MNLKEKLLGLGVFEDNECLDFYCNLIENNRNAKREKFKTQKHHIIPKCYYKYNNLEIDNSKENLVNLLYKDHILAHYYLCLCIINNNLKYKLENAFLHLIKANANFKIKENLVETLHLEYLQTIYEDWKKLNSELQIGKPAWNKGLTKETDKRVAKYSKPRHFSKEHNEHNRQSLLRYYAMHKGTNTGKNLSEETKRKIGESNKGKTRKSRTPEETSRKISNSLKNYYKNNSHSKDKLISYNKTRKLTQETHLKMSYAQPNRLSVFQYDINFTLIATYPSISSCSKSVGIKVWRIKNSCITKSLVKEGFYFRFEEANK